MAVVIALCWVAVFFDGMDVNIYGAVLPHLLDDPDLTLSTDTAGSVGSWTTLGMLCGALAAGTLTDWLGRKPVMVASIVTFSVGSALCALAPTVLVFGAGRCVSGLGLGGLMPVALAVVTEFAPSGRTALATGLMMTSYHAGGMAATGLGLALAPGQGWRWVFWAGVLPAAVAAPLVLRSLPESPTVLAARGRHEEARALCERYALSYPEPGDVPAAGPRDRITAIGRLFAAPTRWVTPLLWIASFAGLLLVYSVLTWLPELMRMSGYSLSSSVTFLLVINAGGIVGMLVAGRAADRFGAVRISALWFVLTAAGTLALSTTLPIAVAYGVVFVSGVWLFSAQAMVYAATADLYSPGQRASGLGWVTGVGRLGAVVGPALGGTVLAGGSASRGFVAFAATAALGATAIALVPLLRFRHGATPLAANTNPS